MQSAQFALHAEIEEQHWWFVARRQILGRLIRAVVPPGQGNLILDVGCGTGANLAALADEYRAVGVDTSSDAIRLARERFPNVDFRQGFAPAAVSDVLGEASLVLLADVLEHVADDLQLFSSLFAAARPGALFLMTVPAHLALWSQHDESFGHYRRYDAERFARIWQGLPVRVLCTSYYNSRLYPLVKAVRWWNRRQGHSRGNAGTDLRLPAAPVNRLLERVLASESDRLLNRLSSGDSRPGFSNGVSLVALVERLPGACAVRSKPADIAGDYFDPQSVAGVQS